jgi:hypothetical protein
MFGCFSKRRVAANGSKMPFEWLRLVVDPGANAPNAGVFGRSSRLQPIPRSEYHDDTDDT